MFWRAKLKWERWKREKEIRELDEKIEASKRCYRSWDEACREKRAEYSRILKENPRPEIHVHVSGGSRYPYGSSLSDI